MASFTAAFGGLKTYLAAIEYTAGKPLFYNVYITTQPEDQAERYPLCRITPLSMEPHSEYPNKLGLFRIDLVIDTRIVGQPMGEGKLIGANRATNEPTGAGLLQILDAIVDSIGQAAAGENAALISWVRMAGDVTFSSPSSDLAQMKIPIEAQFGRQ
jgi:hypothetical protein